MSSAHRKAELKALADAEAWEKATATNRHVDVDIAYPGVGQALLRLACVRSFSPSSLWEVRNQDGRLVAYRSQGTEPGTRYVAGHVRVAVPEEQLASVVQSLQGVTIPISVALPEFAIADADVYIATFSVDFETSLRITWCASAEPKAWSPTVNVLLGLQALVETFPDAV